MIKCLYSTSSEKERYKSSVMDITEYNREIK